MEARWPSVCLRARLLKSDRWRLGAEKVLWGNGFGWNGMCVRVCAAEKNRFEAGLQKRMFVGSSPKMEQMRCVSVCVCVCYSCWETSGRC